MFVCSSLFDPSHRYAWENIVWLICASHTATQYVSLDTKHKNPYTYTFRLRNTDFLFAFSDWLRFGKISLFFIFYFTMEFPEWRRVYTLWWLEMKKTTQKNEIGTFFSECNWNDALEYLDLVVFFIFLLFASCSNKIYISAVTKEGNRITAIRHFLYLYLLHKKI